MLNELKDEGRASSVDERMADPPSPWGGRLHPEGTALFVGARYRRLGAGSAYREAVGKRRWRRADACGRPVRILVICPLLRRASVAGATSHLAGPAWLNLAMAAAQGLLSFVVHAASA